MSPRARTVSDATILAATALVRADLATLLAPYRRLRLDYTVGFAHG